MASGILLVQCFYWQLRTSVTSPAYSATCSSVSFPYPKQPGTVSHCGGEQYPTAEHSDGSHSGRVASVRPRPPLTSDFKAEVSDVGNEPHGLSPLFQENCLSRKFS